MTQDSSERKNKTMPENDERRVDERIVQTAAFSLKIIFTSENPGLLGRSLYGSTIDISASGLKLALQSELPVDSTIDVVVTLKSNPKQYFLSGKVRWCKKADNEGNYHVGIALQDLINTDTDYKAWREALKK
jgi:Tfp pilus assembly protein PilZ